MLEIHNALSGLVCSTRSESNNLVSSGGLLLAGDLLTRDALNLAANNNSQISTAVTTVLLDDPTYPLLVTDDTLHILAASITALLAFSLRYCASSCGSTQHFIGNSFHVGLPGPGAGLRELQSLLWSLEAVLASRAGLKKIRPFITKIQLAELKETRRRRENELLSLAKTFRVTVGCIYSNI